MSCQTVQKFASAYLDRKLAGADREDVSRHLASCRECAAHLEQIGGLRKMLRSIPAAVPPPYLASRLQVLASHERARRLARMTWPARFEHLTGRLALFANNLMRPLALPFAGGVLSALCLFGILVPSLLFQFNFHNDVPTAFYTEASLSDTTPAGFMDDETVVELTINEKGQITDYTVTSGKLDSASQTKLANLVMFSTGTPATLFGYATPGKVLVSFRRSQISVRG